VAREGPAVNHLTDAEIMAIQNSAVESVKRYADNVERELERVRRQLILAESFIPLTKIYAYDLLRKPPSYGGSQ
jgi:hypothetical protein